MPDLVHVLSADGAARDAYFEVTANPIRSAAGRRRVVITSREVTEQVLLTRETKEAARPFDQIPPGIAAVVEANDAAIPGRPGPPKRRRSACRGGEKRALSSERIPLTDSRNELVAVCCVSRNHWALTATRAASDRRGQALTGPREDGGQ
jgi:hypothetical protein